MAFGVCAALSGSAMGIEFEVQSVHDGGVPPVGVTSYPTPTNISCYVTNSPIDLGAGTRVACIGWTGTGDVPEGGATTNTGPFGLTNDSSITWLWDTQALITVSRTRGGGSVTPGTGWYTLGTTQRVTAIAHERCAFGRWDGDTNGGTIDGVSIDVPVDGQRTITAEFTSGPWAYEVVDYIPGANAQPGYGDAMAAIGMPERVTGEGLYPGDVTPFNASWLATETCSVGSGGRLVVAFENPVSNDVLNPYGIDLLVFGNAFFGANDWLPHADWISSEPGSILVSQDGTNWLEIPNVKADHTFPTMGFTDTSTSTTYGYDGTSPTDFLRPVDPALNWTNMTFAQLQPAYDGSGGGTPVDIGSVGLDWIRYVMISQALGQAWSTEIDAFSDVAAVGAFMLRISAQGRGSVNRTSDLCAHGTNVTLIGTPGTYFHFTEWTGDTQGHTATNTMELLMDRDRDVMAVFDPDLTTNDTPVYWLAENGLTNATYPTFADAAMADLDKDGFDAWEEHLAGTDGHDSNSFFTIIDMGHNGASNYVTWRGGTNGSTVPFRVECNDNLTTPWMVLNSAVDRAPSGTNTLWFDGSNDCRFIQIRVVD